MILAETFRSQNAWRRAFEGRFIECAQLLLAWFYSHFWNVDKVSYRGLAECEFSYRDDVTKEDSRDVQYVEPDSSDEEISCRSNDDS
ncbi:hypothetical protein Gogos_020260 [Gossypium gossypioides]|uniref:Uncharacterized protein n=1 Tax=Gossypium gossypioides TaxID=34282 RepID=A0A7J9D7I8_GOSGO|nr:hypothetical protein [Gossypium gossypioides]